MAKAKLEPIVGWFENSLALDDEVVETIDYGTVEAGSDSDEKTFFIINNRNGDFDVPKMEEVNFTTRDRQGGVGDTEGNEVEAVKDNWFLVKVDSLDEVDFTQVGKGGEGQPNESGVKKIGTTGSTTSAMKDTAKEWSAATELEEGTFVKPSDPESAFLYVVVKAGTTGGVEPSWVASAGENTNDGSVTYRAYEIEQTPATGELLGLANNIDSEGNGATDAEGNFAKITVYAEVPEDAKSGINKLLFRCNYKFI